MTTLDPSNVFNVQASLTQWLLDQLGAFDLPAWLPSYGFIDLEPEAEQTYPAFSVNFIDVSSAPRWSGGVGEGKSGSKNTAILEVNAWVSRSNGAWMAQKRTMQAMVQQVVNGARAGVMIQDYGIPTLPNNTGYLIRLGEVETVSTQPDLNPDVERARMLITFTWVVRS